MSPEAGEPPLWIGGTWGEMKPAQIGVGTLGGTPGAKGYRGPAMSESDCELCGGDRFEDFLVACDRVNAGRDDYRYRRCRACSLVSLESVPDDAASAYPVDYEPHSSRQDLRVKRSRRRRSMRELVPPRGGKRLLDIGCGSGRLLARGRDLGWVVSGIEPNERAARSCREQGLDVQTAELSEVSLPAAHFDLVLLHHVIEHIPAPAHALHRVRVALAPDGVVVVVTPNLRSLGFRLYGPCWYAIDAPRHLRLLDAGTLQALARKAGLDAVDVRTESSSRVLDRSRHYQRTQGPVLPPGLAARTAILERSRESDTDSRGFRRMIRPVSWLASRFGGGETLRAQFVAAPESQADGPPVARLS